jgi:hypothetical protein
VGIRRPNRQIEVFDISLMAVVTKAMGAFLVIMLLLMPYYRGGPVYSEPMSKLRDQLEEVKKKLEDVEQNVRRFTDDPEELKRQVGMLLKRLDEAKVRVTELQRQLDQAWAQTERLEGEVTQLQALRQQLESERDALAAQKDMLERENVALKAQLQAAERDIASMRDIDQYKMLTPNFSVVVHTKIDYACVAQKSLQALTAGKLPVALAVFQISREVSAPTEEAQKSFAKLRAQPSSLGEIASNANSGFAMNANLYRGTLPFKNQMTLIESQQLYAFHGASVYFTVEGLKLDLKQFACPIEIRLMIFAGAFSQWIRLPDLVLPDVVEQANRDGPPTRQLLLAVIDATAITRGEAVVHPATDEDVKQLKDKFKLDAFIAAPSTR